MEMGNYLNVGNAGFQSVRKDVYVDKSGLISFINGTLGTSRKMTCVSRPRRFGKSFAAKMLCAYYDKSCDSRELFADLEIAGDPDFEKYLNKYDVIYLDMTWFISITPDIQTILTDLQDKIISELCDAYPDVKAQGTLPEMLAAVNAQSGNKFIFVIDEWDALFREAKNDAALQKDYVQLLRSLFKSSLTDKMIEAAYLTGILPIKKYGTQSAMTDFREYTMIQPGPLDEYVGFTEDEVRVLCESSKLSFESMQQWYDGYILGDNVHVYNPKSVMDALLYQRLGSYWTHTETYSSLKVYIDMDFDGLKESIVQMLGGASVSIDTGTFQNDMTSIQSRDDVLTLLVHLGYLAYDADCETVRIPNEEVRQEFVRAVKHGSHKELAKLVQTSDLLLKATLRMDSDMVATSIAEAHSAGTAPLFYNDEQALRSVIRFAYLSCVDEYLRIEELPTGYGYADVVYLPKQGSPLPILVVELKWNKTAEAAIAQIKNKNYPQALEGYGNEILLVGINYDEKTKEHTCVIESHHRNIE
jgi:hypothetical protein